MTNDRIGLLALTLTAGTLAGCALDQEMGDDGTDPREGALWLADADPEKGFAGTVMLGLSEATPRPARRRDPAPARGSRPRAGGRRWPRRIAPAP